MMKDILLTLSEIPYNGAYFYMRADGAIGLSVTSAGDTRYLSITIGQLDELVRVVNERRVESIESRIEQAEHQLFQTILTETNDNIDDEKE